MSAPLGGQFATSRRGGLTRDQIREIEAHRAKDRPTPWQALSNRYGRTVSDLQAAVDKTPIYAPALIEPVDIAPAQWSEEDERRLRVMFIDLDLPATAVAAALGRTRESIIGKARTMGLKKRVIGR